MVASLPAVHYAYAAYVHGGYGLSVLIPDNQQPKWREVRRLEFGLNINVMYLVHCYDCKLSVLTFVQRTFSPERRREGSALHGKCNNLRL